jgi:hypothetical protein
MTSETVAFADAERGVYGMARGSLAVLFRGQELLGTGAPEIDAFDWDTPSRARFTGDGCGFDIELEPTCAAIDGREQLARVTGEAWLGDERIARDGAGQRGRGGGVDWSACELVRDVSAWLGDGGILLQAQRPQGAKAHDAETLSAALVERGEPIAITDPRLSTTYDGDGHQRRAGLELWLTDEDGYPVRAAGEVICGSSLELDDLTLDLAFFRWHSEGTTGVGRYDITRRSG